MNTAKLPLAHLTGDSSSLRRHCVLGETGIGMTKALGLLLGLCLIISPGCKSKSELARQEIEAEIVDLFDKFREATAENDYETLFGLSSPDNMKRMIFEAIVAMGSTAKTKESEAILAKYIDPERVKQIGQTLQNPTEDEVTQMYMMSMSQPKAFFVEAFKLIHKLNPNRQKPIFGELKDLKISGNIASGKSSFTVSNLAGEKISTEEREITVYFIRIKNMWFYATEREWSGVSQ